MDSQVGRCLQKMKRIFKGNQHAASGHMGQKTELMAEICPIRAIGKVLLMKFSEKSN